MLHPARGGSLAACVSVSSEERRLRGSIQPVRQPACAGSDRRRRARHVAVCYASQPAQSPELARRDAQTADRSAAGALAAQLDTRQQPQASEQQSGIVPAAPATPVGTRSRDDGEARPVQQWASRPALRDAFSRPSQPARTGGQQTASRQPAAGSQQAAEATPANDAGGTSVGSVISSGNGVAGSMSGAGSFSAQVRVTVYERATVNTIIHDNRPSRAGTRWTVSVTAA